jgi:hypothetical protein
MAISGIASTGVCENTGIVVDDDMARDSENKLEASMAVKCVPDTQSGGVAVGFGLRSVSFVGLRGGSVVVALVTAW